MNLRPALFGLGISLGLAGSSMGGGPLLARAAAQPADAVSLNVPDCLDARGDDVKKLVALELAPRLRVTAVDDASEPITGSVQCPPGEAVTITVVHPARPKPLRVELDLAQAAPPARTRLLALSIAELIATSLLEHGARAEPAPEPAPPPEADADTDADTDTDASAGADLDAAPYRIWLAPGISRAGEPATLLFGVDAGGSRALGPLSCAVELQARWGAAELSAADVAVQVLSASLALSPVLAWPGAELSLGPGLRAGHLQLSAESNRAGFGGDDLSRGWLGALLVAVAQFDLHGASALRVAVEAGHVLYGVTGQDASAGDLIALRGFWFSAALGLALKL